MLIGVYTHDVCIDFEALRKGLHPADDLDLAMELCLGALVLATYLAFPPQRSLALHIAPAYDISLDLRLVRMGHFVNAILIIALSFMQ